ncbi:MAG: cytochrome c oxidase subunit II [Bacteroidales bacterium]|jgi:cytochrome c oxidase subunit 2|nr:cytochrome c oxidase subunit II [Bacteroidales bacterium]NLM93369.1 cytochrome c oxidase subunit II [Bacteroidales bacterium]
MNPGASNFVEGVNNAFIFIIGISLFFLIGITLVIILFLYRYNKKRHPKAVQIEGSNKLEVIWTIIPLALVMGMFYYGYVGWKPMKRIPDEGVRITANARMWSFSFTYENGRITEKLYVPVDTAVIVRLNALDVVHSLYIPAFRVKEDMVPGLANNQMWFQPNKVGNYSLFCTEYCGLQHSFMHTEVVVMEPAEFWEWYSDTTAVAIPIEEGADLALLGRQLVESKGCLACHSLDGSTIIGPSFLGAWGSNVPVVTNGQEREVAFDEAYVLRSIYEPDADIHQGYRAGQMFSYQGEITEQQIELIVEFLKSLNE